MYGPKNSRLSISELETGMQSLGGGGSVTALAAVPASSAQLKGRLQLTFEMVPMVLRADG